VTGSRASLLFPFLIYSSSGLRNEYLPWRGRGPRSSACTGEEVTGVYAAKDFVYNAIKPASAIHLAPILYAKGVYADRGRWAMEWWISHAGFDRLTVTTAERRRSGAARPFVLSEIRQKRIGYIEGF